MPDILATEPEAKVPLSQELIRISRLPRRMQTPEELDGLVREMTEVLKTPAGTMQLRPLQAAALYELGTEGGLFAPVSVGGGKCVAGDTEVFDEIEKRRQRVDTFGISTTTAKNGEGKLVLAGAVAFASGTKECVRLTLKDGSAVTLSNDHPVFTARGWVQAASVGMSDLVATARSVPEPRWVTEISDDEVVLAAYLLSDGGVSQAQTGFTNASLDILADFCGVVERLADYKKNKHISRKVQGITSVTQPSKAYELRVSGLSWFRRKWDINGLAKHKRLPASFWALSEKQVALFLNRFWACDGYVALPKGLGVILASEKMIDDLRFLLLRLGVQSRKAYKAARLKGKVFDAWRLSIPAYCTERFFATVGMVLSKESQCQQYLDHLRRTKRNTNVDIVPLSCSEVYGICSEMGLRGRGGDWKIPRKNQPRTEIYKFLGATDGQFIGREKFKSFCKKYLYRGRFAWLADSDLCWEHVKSVETKGLLPVYDLSVPEYGCFVGNHIVLHNTAISLLAPVVTFSQHPLLLVPAKLVGKTKHDQSVLREHWDLPALRTMSYEWLGRAQAAEALEDYQPDLIILDECHKVRRLSAAVSRRVKRYFATHPETKCVALSGTITKRSLHDYAHLIHWALGPVRMPLPRSYSDLELWADALDERKGQVKRADPAALEILCNAEEKKVWREDRRKAARMAFRRRLVETAGVVASAETAVDATLTIQAVEPKVSEQVDLGFKRLREDWETLDGWPLADGLEVFRHARELAIGFYYIWDPRPPAYWLEARKAWCKFVRQVLGHSHKLDSELQVRRAYPDSEFLKAWQAVAKDFEPNTVPVWLDDSVLKYCVEWAEREKGIIWTEHTTVGERLGEMGLIYYGKRGLSAAGRPIESHPVGTPLVASIQSNSEGRNLQAWNANLITSCPPHGSGMEQCLGRTHREGQEADEVSVDVIVTCVEHVGAFWQAMRDCEYVAASTGAPQKLLLAGVNFPSADDIAVRSGPRWNK